MTLAIKSLEVLDRCYRLLDGDGGDTRQQRFEELIADFDDGAFGDAPRIACDKNWAFCITTSFRAALDIRQTNRIVDGKATVVWTQGPWFSFSEGDTIYDSVAAYKAWNPGAFNICLKVIKGSPVLPRTETNRWSAGAVIFDILTPDEYRSKLVVRRQTAVTQFEFVRLLIQGPPPEWQDVLRG